MDSISIKVQNQIIVQRLFQSGYVAKDIINLDINNLNRSTVYRQAKLLESGEKIGYGKGETGPSCKLDDLTLEYLQSLISSMPKRWDQVKNIARGLFIVHCLG